MLTLMPSGQSEQQLTVRLGYAVSDAQRHYYKGDFKEDKYVWSCGGTVLEAGNVEPVPRPSREARIDKKEPHAGGNGVAAREDAWHLYAACARHASVVHAAGGASLEAAVAAASGSSYAPLFAPAPGVLEAISQDFGLHGSDFALEGGARTLMWSHLALKKAA